MTKWNYLKRDIPNGVDSKEFIKLGKKIDHKISYSDFQLETKEGRDEVKKKLMKAKPLVFRVFSIFRKWLEQGHNRELDREKAKMNAINTSFKEMRKVITEFQTGVSRGQSHTLEGIMKKDTSPMAIIRFRNLIGRLFNEVIAKNVKDACDMSDTPNEFYNSLFDRVFTWAGIEVYNVYVPQEGEVEEEEEKEEIELDKSDSKIDDRIGEIS